MDRNSLEVKIKKVFKIVVQRSWVVLTIVLRIKWLLFLEDFKYKYTYLYKNIELWFKEGR